LGGALGPLGPLGTVNSLGSLERTRLAGSLKL
jgi:hypothetical protein